MTIQLDSPAVIDVVNVSNNNISTNVQSLTSDDGNSSNITTRKFITISSQDKTISEKHESIRQDVSKTFNKLLYVALSYAFTYSMRTNLIILYALTFYDNTTTISLVVNLSYLTSAFMSLFFGIFGDKRRFDYLLIASALFDVITFFMEASANSFIILAIAYSIGGQPFEAICHSWNVKMLPTYYAQQFQARFMQLFILGYILGPIIGGILAHFFGYRIVFYISAVISLILFCVTVRFFGNNVEIYLLNQQLTMVKEYHICKKNVSIETNSDMNGM